MATAPRRVHGADISHHQSAIDLSRAKAAGLEFLYHKATEGDSFVDSQYDERRIAAAKAGIPFGAYHFARAEYLDGKPDAVAEARRFVGIADPRPGDLLPALDLETPEGLSRRQLKRWAKIFMSEVERLTGAKSALYSPWDFRFGLLRRRPVRWVPRYNNTNTPPTIPWDIWQFSNGAFGVPNTFPGLGHVDLNTFREGFTIKDLLIPVETEVDCIQYNVGNTSSKVLRAELTRLTRLGSHAISLNEVGDRADEIRDVPGYQTIVQRTEPSSGKTAILLRDDLPVLNVRLQKISDKTEVEKIVAGAAKDGTAEAKFILSVLTQINGVKVRFGTVHFVPSTTKVGAPKARALFRTQVEETVRFLTTGRNHKVLMGDLNAGVGTIWITGERPLSPLAKVATFLSAVSHGLRRIDHIVIPKTATNAAVAALDGFNSDHRPVRGRFRLSKI